MNKSLHFCQHCDYFFKETDYLGSCKRFPPVPIVQSFSDEYGNQYGEVKSLQPIVNNNDTCGEWK